MDIPVVAWLEAFAQQLGIDAPSEQEREDLLALAGTAAHSTERIAAPIACWMAARAGVAPREACEVARAVVVSSSNDD